MSDVMQNDRPMHEREGRVVSNKMQKTVIVTLERIVRHPVYKKVLRRVTRIKAHDEHGICKVGDRVRMVPSRPLSKEKRWRVVGVLENGKTK